MTDVTTAAPIQILLVEDSEDDVLLTRETLREGKVANDLHVVSDGEQAMSYLRQEGENDCEPRPSVMLLDLNLPRKDGLEVLEEIKSDRSLRSIPVIVLTTSSDERDVVRAYERYVNAYVTKPVDSNAFIAAVRAVEDFWLSIVRLPGMNHAGGPAGIRA